MFIYLFCMGLRYILHKIYNLLMNKLIKQYQEKSKIIYEIQKNLRMTKSKSPRFDNKQRKKLINQTFQIDLPTINVRHDYTPRSQNIPLQKRYSLQYSKQQSPEKAKKQNNRPYIQTISFDCDQLKQQSPVLLINRKTSGKNFIFSARTIQCQNHKQRQKFKEMLMSTGKFIFTNRNKFRQSQYLKQLKKRQVQKQITNQHEQQQFFKVQNLHKKHSQQVIQHIVATQINKKQKQKEKQRQKQKVREEKLKQIQKLRQKASQINQDTNVKLQVQKNSKRDRRHFNPHKKTYSPWNAGDNEQPLQCWESNS